MGFKCGIIGLPNVGKSTLYNALTKSSIEAANFPFCTIEPNTSIVSVPDVRIEQISEIIKPKNIVLTNMKFVDIAGLVKGASKGEGLGNQFLANIRETDAICHVVRCFEKNNIIHITGKINPIEDINIINTELVLSDLNTCEQAIKNINKKNQICNKHYKNTIDILAKCQSHLLSAKMLRTLNLDINEKSIIHYLKFLTLKPIMYIANLNEEYLNNNLYLKQVLNIAKMESSIVIPICASIESEISKLDDNERKEFILELGIEDTCLNKVIRAGYSLLNLLTYFTVGIKEVRAWSIPIGSTALQASGKIHTDFMKGFIRAQIIDFNDFISFKGEQGAKIAGKIRLEGKNYIVKDGDIIKFLFNI